MTMGATGPRGTGVTAEAGRDEKLARSLTAETTELLPFLPYLLQDLWELGSNPRDMARLIRKHLRPTEGAAETTVLDLACGKGAVSVYIAREFGFRVHGFDLTPEFIEYARKKAEEYQVTGLCRFTPGDANEVVNQEKDYDCVIFGAAGNILGSPGETLRKLAQTVRPSGYILIDEAYLPDGADNAGVQYQNYDFLTRTQWLRLFEENGLTMLEEMPNTEGYSNFEADNRNIALRARELTAKHPEKAAVFAGYVQSQLNECADLEEVLAGGTWILQKL